MYTYILYVYTCLSIPTYISIYICTDLLNAEGYT